MIESKSIELKIEEIGPQLINILAELANAGEQLTLIKSIEYTEDTVTDTIKHMLAVAAHFNMDIGKSLVEKLKNEYLNRNVSTEGKENEKV